MRAPAFSRRRAERGALAAVVETHQRSPQTVEASLTRYRELLYGEGRALKPGQNGE